MALTAEYPEPYQALWVSFVNWYVHYHLGTIPELTSLESEVQEPQCMIWAVGGARPELGPLYWPLGQLQELLCIAKTVEGQLRWERGVWRSPELHVIFKSSAGALHPREVNERQLAPFL